MNINLINYTIESKELFLLCRPIGGLNDNLCQIEKCWRYAENFARTLIIDTRNSGGFFGEFSDYFIPQNPLRKVYSNTTEIDSSTNLLITRKLDSYVPIYSEHLHNFIDRKSGKLISFDFDKKYSEPILIHEQCGGGILSFDLLKRVPTSEKLRSIVFDRLKHLINRKYVAIHIRNTDYQTNYESLFKQISPIVVNKSVLVCSDDAQVIKIAKSYFYSSNVLTASEIPQTNQKPLHMKSTYMKDTDYKTSAINAIVDLFALGLSNELHFMNITAGYPSGFSILAKHLNENKKIIFNLLKMGRWERWKQSWHSH